MTDPAPIRIALVGCGRIAKNHLEAIERIDGLTLAGVCDSVPERAREVGEKYGVPWFRTIEELLPKTESDAIAICTPSGLHPQQGVLAARAGKHVITEKPMAISLRAADELVAACDQAGVQLFVVKQNRRNATVQLVKRAVESGRFGRLYMVNCNVFWSRPQSYYDSARWRGTWEFDGGAIMNQASHYVDLLDWLIGPVESVQAMTATLARHIQVEDTGVVNVRWRSGALGSLNVTMLTYPKNFEGSLTILGEQGTVRLGGVAINEIEHWEFAEPHADDALVKDASYDTTSVYGHGHTRYYENVIASLRGETTAETDGREGLRSLELLIGIYLSARDGRTVSLPLDM